MSGLGEKLKGSVHEMAGKVTGDDKLEAQGKVEQVAGNLQDRAEDMKDTIGEKADEMRDTVGEKANDMLDHAKDKTDTSDDES